MHWICWSSLSSYLVIDFFGRHAVRVPFFFLPSFFPHIPTIDCTPNVTSLRLIYAPSLLINWIFVFAYRKTCSANAVRHANTEKGSTVICQIESDFLPHLSIRGACQFMSEQIESYRDVKITILTDNYCAAAIVSKYPPLYIALFIFIRSRIDFCQRKSPQHTFTALIFS